MRALPAPLRDAGLTLPPMTATTWDDLKPLALALLRSPDMDVLVNHLDDLADIRVGCLCVVAEVDRLADAPNDEAMGTGDLFHALCRELKLDLFEQPIPGIPEDLPLEEIPWTAGLYRALIAKLGCANVLPTVRLRAAWRAKFYEAGAAIRAAVPPTIDRSLPCGHEEPALTLAEASAALGCHPKTTERYLRSGELRAGRVGRRWRIPRSSVEAFLRADVPREP